MIRRVAPVSSVGWFVSHPCEEIHAHLRARLAWHGIAATNLHSRWTHQAPVKTCGAESSAARARTCPDGMSGHEVVQTASAMHPGS
jgi:hypothetical protein